MFARYRRTVQHVTVMSYAGGASVHRYQMRQAVAQLIAQLDDKKKEISNVVDTYRKSGQDSVTHLKQQCLQDSDRPSNTSR
ncbi:hypothetical protein THARTR1_06989 [Trichoderma harzianum]|uniref:Uncharacterized protein n=1 Tax=Trichoderma harzianum TaxID=5544 RepID=A0A2K0U3N2_TRIHA|nr:hypothetical protein THARTR1_06989 [Trichoderma harzianum]